MKLVTQMGLAAVVALIASPASAQNTPDWMYISTSSRDSTFYVDTANIDRNGAYIRYYEKFVRSSDGSFSISNVLVNCDTNIYSILSINVYFPTGRLMSSSSTPTVPVDILPGTVGWTVLQTVCTTPSTQYARPHSLNTFEPLGEGMLVSTSSSYINVRERPGIDAPISRQGTSGDEVVIWDSAFVNGYTWYKIAFRGSNATGWVREDLIRIGQPY